MDGWGNIRDFKEFIYLFGPACSRSWIHTLRNPLILGDWEDRQGTEMRWKEMWRILKDGNTKLDNLPYGKCDVLIYCSSNKPNVYPALFQLAKCLSSAGVSTLYWGPKRFDWFNSLQTSTSSLRPTLHRDYNIWRKAAFFDLPASLWHTGWVYLKTVRANTVLAKRLRSNPRRLLAEIVLARHAEHTIGRWLKHLKPSLIITNGEQTPVGVGLTAAAKIAAIRTVWFFNEWPTAQQLPVLSDELWVWNDIVAQSMKTLQPAEFSRPQIEVIGLAQLDCMEEQAECGVVKPVALPRERYLLYLSEHIPVYAHNNHHATERSLAWLADTARRTPQWNFLIKLRPYHTDAPLPGESHLEGLDNITILRDNVSIAELLATKSIRAFAALSSSGLLLAAATGRQAFRLAVTGEPYPIEPLDNAVQRINSADALCDALAMPTPEINNSVVPYRGQVLKRMCSLCMQRIVSMQIAKS